MNNNESDDTRAMLMSTLFSCDGLKAAFKLYYSLSCSPCRHEATMMYDAGARKLDMEDRDTLLRPCIISQYTQPSPAKTSTPLRAALDVIFVRRGVCPRSALRNTREATFGDSVARERVKGSDRQAMQVADS